eukprot:5318586-Pleurochrysis_carterae.AAC.1
MERTSGGEGTTCIRQKAGSWLRATETLRKEVARETRRSGSVRCDTKLFCSLRHNACGKCGGARLNSGAKIAAK